eukprot:COSAG04_NODE_1752_length_5696_cov_32.262679_8_plen_56_part_00
MRVPFGPRFDLTTSAMPFADAMFMASACPRETISAWSLTCWIFLNLRRGTPGVVG